MVNAYGHGSLAVLLLSAALISLTGCEMIESQTGLNRPTQEGAVGGAAFGGIIAALANANPAWIAGMMHHGYCGAAEIARSVDGLFGFAAVLPQRLDQQFDILFTATLGDPDVDAFLRAANPAARDAMTARFRDAAASGLWRSRRNAVAEILGSGRL